MEKKSKKPKKDDNQLIKNAFSDVLIPTEIFQQRPLTVLESLIYYLHEQKHLSFVQISALLKRERRNVKKAYRNAKLKYVSKEITQSLAVPVSLFSNRRVSAFESLVFYLKQNLNLSLQEISKLLNRSSSTIRVVYSRARKKYAN